MYNEPPKIKIDEGRYGRAIRAAAYIGAAAGVVFGIAISVIAIWKLGGHAADRIKSLRGLIGAPILFGLLGSALGVAVMCAFAPSTYLESRAARNWMNVIGTQTVGGARVVCLLVLSIVTALFAGAIWFILTKMIVAAPLG